MSMIARYRLNSVEEFNESYDGDWYIITSGQSFEFKFSGVPNVCKDDTYLSINQNNLENAIDIKINGVLLVDAVSGTNGVTETNEWKVPPEMLDDYMNKVEIYHNTGSADWGHIYNVTLYSNTKYVKDDISNIDGKAVGNPVTEDGKLDRCIKFDGVDDYIIANDISKRVFGRSFGISYWINFTTALSLHTVSFNTASGGNSLLFGILNGKIDLYTGTLGHVTTPSLYNDGEWHHISINVDIDNNRIYQYVDGRQTNLVEGNLTTVNIDDTFTLGQEYDGGLAPSQLFNGKLEDVRIYDSMISSDEINELSKAKILHYKFDNFVEPTENLLTNPLTTLTNWRPSGFGDSFAGTSYTLLEGEGLDSDNAVRVERIASGDNNITLSSSDVNLNKTVSVGVGEKVTLSCFLHEQSTEIKSGGIRLHIYGSTDDTNTTISVGSGYATRESMSKISWTYTNNTSESITFIHLYITSADSPERIGSYFKVSDIQLEVKDHATPFVNGIRDYGIISDCSGQGNDGIVNIDTTPEWTNDTLFGSGSYYFDGSSSFIETKDTIKLGYNDFSLVTWYKPSSFSDYTHFFSAILQEDFSCKIDQSGYPYFYAGNSFRTQSVDVNNPLVIGDWVFIAYVYDGNSIKIYINGVLVNTDSSITTPRLIEETKFRIQNHSSEYGNGTQTDTRLYTSALSQDDISSMYQQIATMDSEGNYNSHTLVENVEFAVNLVKHPLYSDKIYGNVYSTFNWGGDYAEVTYLESGGYMNMPYRKMIKTVGGSGGSYKNENGPIYIKSNTTYTISVYSKASRELLVNEYWISLNRLSDNYYITMSGQTITTEWSRYSYTFTTNSTDHGDYYIRSIMYTDDNLPVELSWCAIQLEERNYPTPFTKDYREDPMLLDGFVYGENVLTPNGIKGTEASNEIGVTDGLVGYWKLDGDTLDYSGKGNDGINNGATITSGLGQKAYYFDGSNDSITLPFTPNPSEQYTIIFWVRANTLIGTGRNNLILGSGTTWNPGLWARNDMLRVHCENEYRDCTIDWNDTNWHMVGQVFDGVNCFGIWDGNIISGNTTSYSPPLNSNLLVGAGTVSGDSYNWDGSFQDVRIYNRALTDNEVKINYDLGRKDSNDNYIETLDGQVYTKGELSEVNI